ncbi:TIGR00730 family Rossman fold protein [Candidatus Kaiserbacteria bacterium]|nr:TIGR00730 family Rossman fold protein [Candidatus Kaiserbacteria bacterium]
MNICVFCSGQEVDGKYTKDATELGRLIGSKGHTLVWGGSNGGLMRAVADAVQNAGGKIVGVSVEFLREKARENADEMVVTKDLAERKELLLSRSDAIVVLPGGTGTLDEIGEVLERKKHRMYEKPVVVLNAANFYDGLRMQLQKMSEEGFLNGTVREYVFFAETPADAIASIEKNAQQ